MVAKLNCWEAISCRREPGGESATEFGVCPAATDTSLHGINGGTNGGRICWAVAGTFCGGEVKSGGADERRATCMSCEFFARIIQEEGANLTMVRPGQTTWVGSHPQWKAGRGRE